MSDDGDEPVDPAHALLARMRKVPAAAPKRRVRRRVVSPEDQKWSGPRADDRDPTRLGAAVDGLVERSGWRKTLNEVSLEPRWAEIVGSAIAEHARPDKIAGGELTIIAESTAWATQIRLMSRSLLERIAAEVGDGVITKIRVTGPTGPDWKHGALRVRGRGPRDTYG